MKCDGTRAETTFRLSAIRTRPFKSAGASVQSTTGSRGVRISDINAGYTMFRGSVKGTGYPLHSPVSPFTSPPMRHRVPSHFNWTLRTATEMTVDFLAVLIHTWWVTDQNIIRWLVILKISWIFHSFEESAGNHCCCLFPHAYNPFFHLQYLFIPEFIHSQQPNET